MRGARRVGRHLRGAAGARRADRAQGRRHSRKRIARLMRAAGRRGRAPRRWRTTTIPDPAAPMRPDLIGRDFRVAPDRVNTRWCGDITYINTWEGWLYLATVIDLASRRVVGWATADHLRTDLVDQALSNAVTARRPTGPVIFHSDRGCQYTSAQYAAARRRSRRPPVGRASRAVLGQRGRRVVLRHHQDRTTRPAGLAHPGRRPQGDLRVDRGLVQHPPSTLHIGLSQPSRLRSRRLHHHNLSKVA